ncbi:Uncharacterised protein [Mycobacteroides abscessus subsp. abscessus]|nr:Uncharacterised protein [Mycobacteroides abscessus subsp. abscessus]
MVANRLRVLVRLPGEEQIHVPVVEVRPLGGRGRSLLMQQVQQDRQLHGVTGQFADVRLAALFVEACA